MSWNKNLIPDSDRQMIIDYFNAGNIKELMKYHNRARLSGDIVCCDAESIKNNFKTIINEWETE